MGPLPSDHAPSSALSQLVDCKRIQGAMCGQLQFRRARIVDWQLAWPPTSHTHCPCAWTCRRPSGVLASTHPHVTPELSMLGVWQFFHQLLPTPALHFYLWTEKLALRFIAVVGVDEILTVVIPKKPPDCSSWFGPGAGVSFLP